VFINGGSDGRNRAGGDLGPVTPPHKRKKTTQILLEEENSRERRSRVIKNSFSKNSLRGNASSLRRLGEGVLKTEKLAVVSRGPKKIRPVQLVETERRTRRRREKKGITVFRTQVIAYAPFRKRGGNAPGTVEPGSWCAAGLLRGMTGLRSNTDFPGR